MRESGEWVAEKLDYLERYINIFQTSMHQKQWHATHYIDLFAGPGKCVVPETGSIYLGSPLLSLTTSYPCTSYFFLEMDPENVAALQQRCQRCCNRMIRFSYRRRLQRQGAGNRRTHPSHGQSTPARQVVIVELGLSRSCWTSYAVGHCSDFGSALHDGHHYPLPTRRTESVHGESM